VVTAPGGQGSDEAASSARLPAEVELASLQSVARWLVGSAAVVLAALVTGVQLSSLGRLEDGAPWQLPVAVAAGLLALTVVAVILTLAARVLVNPGWSLNELAHLDENGNWTNHWLKAELDKQRGLLIPDDNLEPRTLYQRHLKLARAWFQLQELGGTSLPVNLDGDEHSAQISYDLASDDDVARLRTRLGSAVAIANSLAAIANLETVRRRYRRLTAGLWAGVVAVVAVPVFVWATTTDPEPPVTTPIAAHVQMTSDEAALVKARLPVSCQGLIVEGVAVGGTMPRPIVVSTTTRGCVLDRVRITSDLGTVILVPRSQP
jgi:hypothetical protein